MTTDSVLLPDVSVPATPQDMVQVGFLIELMRRDQVATIKAIEKLRQDLDEKFATKAELMEARTAMALANAELLAVKAKVEKFDGIWNWTIRIILGFVVGGVMTMIGVKGVKP